jgi:hypothetical protein
MKHPSTWDKSDLHAHLRHALALELWTIPLYLTALYSIKGVKNLKHAEYPDAAKLIFSVVVQEMLHLELVSNISNALGYSPVFTTPNYDEHKGIPFIHPTKDKLPALIQGYAVKPQALNQHSLRLFCAIELPHPPKEIIWNKEKSYDSICELYEALKIGVVKLWDECYVGHDRNNKQKSTFREYHNTGGRNHGFSQSVNTPATALKAIDAIIEQGEGANSKYVRADFRPPELEEGKTFDTAWYKGHLSHFQKFRILLHSHHHLPEVYTESGGEAGLIAQQNLDKVFSEFLSELQGHFNSEGESLPDSFWHKMHGIGNAIAEVWEAGRCPQFNTNMHQLQI